MSLLKRRKNTKSKAIIAVAVLLAAALSVFFAFVLTRENGEDASDKHPQKTVSMQNDNPTSDPEKAPETHPEPVITRKTISFSAVGDNIIHASVMEDARNNAQESGKEFDFLPMYENIADIIKESDFAYVNHEAPVAGRDNRGYTGYPMFNSPEQSGLDLVETGFNVVNMANNHMLDRGDTGYKSTVEFWNSIENITPIGGFLNKEDYENIRVIEKNGIKIALLSYTYGTNGISLGYGSELVIPYCDSSCDEEIARQVKLAKEKADFVVVSMHWGVEHWSDSYEPSALQKRQAQLLADNNVDVVIGSHPHTLEPMMYLDRPDGKKMLLTYSLGNFLSNMEYMRNHVGGILKFDLVMDEGEKTVENVRFIPTVCHFELTNKNYRIYKLSDYTGEMLEKHCRQVDGPDSKRSLEYLKGIVDECIPQEFLVDDLYKKDNEVTGDAV